MEMQFLLYKTSFYEKMFNSFSISLTRTHTHTPTRVLPASMTLSFSLSLSFGHKHTQIVIPLFRSLSSYPYVFIFVDSTVCNVYVSASNDHQGEVIDMLKKHADSFRRDCALANVFIDEPYRRSSFTMVSRATKALADAASSLSRVALNHLDFSAHDAYHPRLGSVDHISCHALHDWDEKARSQTSRAAQTIAENLGTGPDAIPVYLYGLAHPDGRKLADVRRSLGYFKDSPGGRWNTSVDSSTIHKFPPDFGPHGVNQNRGVCCVGAVPWVMNFNILLSTNDLPLAKSIAKVVSQRAGGMDGVESMALKHADGCEIACNLLRSDVVGAEHVEAAVSRAAVSLGVNVIRSYRIGKTAEELARIANTLPKSS